MVHQEGFSGRCQKVLQVAKELYLSKPDWVTFFRETLGVNGAARSVFTTQAEYVSFEKCAEYNEIQQMVLNLRNRKIPGNGSNEPTRVITVRLPESLHEALKAEASDHNTSMNKLCISKLLQVLIEAAKPANAASAMTHPVPAPNRTALPPVPKPSPKPPVPAPSLHSQSTGSMSPSFRSTYEPHGNGQSRFGQ
jgi:predicted HicB family RNase H-like nuclease